MQAHRSFRQFVGTTEAELLVWLRQILARTLANLMRSYYGAQRRDMRLEHELDAELQRSSGALDRGFVDPQSSPSQRAARREQDVILADALERLSRDRRGVIVLRHLEQHSFPEIARQMDRTLDSVKNLWARAQLRHSARQIQ